jgi:hypothetical protein
MILATGGKIHKINRGIIFEKKGKIMSNWIKLANQLKAEGTAMNKQQSGSGDALRSFGKLLANASYG